MKPNLLFLFSLDYLTTPDVLTDDVPDLAIGLMLVVLRKLL
jgi:lactate dehydrogenase-like 2-hydroxyacid dehydrogenase